MKVAGAPITWGICEVPGWGAQLAPERVLREVASLGLTAMELGPQGFLPGTPAEIQRLLACHGLRLAAGFVPVVLHRAELRDGALATLDTEAATLAEAGAELLVLAAALDGRGYERSADLTRGEWDLLLEGLASAHSVGERHGLAVALHPHYGTAIERAHQVAEVVNRSDIGLCLDTGHLMVGGVDAAEIVRAAGSRVIHVHLKDVDAGLAARVRSGELGYRDAVMRGMYRPLGDGDVDLLAVLELLSVRGYAGWYVLEQDVVLDGEPAEGAGPVVSAARSIDFLTRILPQ